MSSGINYHHLIYLWISTDPSYFRLLWLWWPYFELMINNVVGSLVYHRTMNNPWSYEDTFLNPLKSCSIITLSLFDLCQIKNLAFLKPIQTWMWNKWLIGFFAIWITYNEALMLYKNSKNNCAGRYPAAQEQDSCHALWICSTKMRELLVLKSGPVNFECSLRTVTLVTYTLCRIWAHIGSLFSLWIDPKCDYRISIYTMNIKKCYVQFCVPSTRLLATGH